MDICICVSGSMRNFEGNFQWLHDARVDHNIDVVVATWTQRGGKLSGALGPSRLPGMLPEGVFTVLPVTWLGKHFFEVLPELKNIALKRMLDEHISDEQLQSEIPGCVAHVEDAFPFEFFEGPRKDPKNAIADDPFSLRSLYKIWQADIMRRNLEYTRNKKYDVVVRVRPDRVPKSIDKIILGKIKHRSLWIDAVNLETGFAGDQFALGDSDTMVTYANAFLWALEQHRNGTWVQIHSSLFQYLASERVELNFYPDLPDYSRDNLIMINDFKVALHHSLEQNTKSTLRYFELKDLNDAEILSTSIALANIDSVDPSPSSILDLQRHANKLALTYRPERDAGFLLCLCKSSRLNLSVGHKISLFMLCLDGIKSEKIYYESLEYPNALKMLVLSAAEIDDALLNNAVKFSGHGSIGIEVLPSYLKSLSLITPDEDTRARTLRLLEYGLIQIRLKDPIFWLKIGGIFERRKSLSKAISAYQTSITESQLGQLRSKSHLSLLLARHGDREAASSLCESVREAPTQDQQEKCEVFTKISETYAYLDDTIRASEVLQDALKIIDSENFKLKNLLQILTSIAAVSLQVGRPDISENASRYLVSLFPTDQYSFIRLQRSLASLGRIEESKAALRDGIKSCAENRLLINLLSE